MHPVLIIVSVVVYAIITAIVACYYDERFESGTKVLLPASVWFITVPFFIWVDVNTLRITLMKATKRRREYL